MGFIAWIILGLIAGSIARAIVPGRVSGGWIASIILGVIGALVGGWIASALFNVNVNESFFSLATWGFAIIGGVVVALIYSFITSRGAKK